MANYVPVPIALGFRHPHLYIYKDNSLCYHRSGVSIHQGVTDVIGLRLICRRDMFFIIGIFCDTSGAGIIDVNGRDGDNRRRSSVDCCFQSRT